VNAAVGAKAGALQPLGSVVRRDFSLARRPGLIQTAAMLRARAAAIALFTALTLVSGCATLRRSLLGPPEPKKLNVLQASVPADGELPPLVGKLQETRVAKGETLLDVARKADLGYQQVQDANPGLDPWIPAPGTDVVLPSQWILPASRHRGIVINLPEMRLYLYPDATRPGEAVEVQTWPIGIGTDETPSPIHSFKIITKEKNPTWIVPASILKTMDPPRKVVPPGPDNPLGAYRMRLSYDIYSIHGTDTPWAIGRLTTHGCIRLYPEDIPVLFDEVHVGTEGEMLYQPVKLGEQDGRIFVEVHPDVYGRIKDLSRHALAEVRKAGVAKRIDKARLLAAVEMKRGIPVDVTRD
jgi:L,D-transpeptidase ErfK/SrfK